MICTKCSKDKHETEFSWHIKDKTRKRQCKSCVKAYSRNHYLKNPAPYLLKNKKKNTHNKKFVNEYKAKTPCKDCGVRYPDEPYLLEFDHLKDKLHCVSNILHYSLKIVQKEIDKCDLVCLICHRRRTAKRANWKNLINK